jgi:hypothetical protein
MPGTAKYFISQFLLAFVRHNSMEEKVSKYCTHAVKNRLAVSSSAAGMSLTKLYLSGKNSLLLARESLACDIPTGDEETAYLFFYSVCTVLTNIRFHDVMSNKGQ